MTGNVRWLSNMVVGSVLFLGQTLCPAETNLPVHTARFQATDTLSPSPDNRPAAQAFLRALAWEPGPFEVECTSTPGLAYDALVRFDSPKPSGTPGLDRVVLTWYAARDDNGEAIEAPAVLIVHSLHPRMIVASQIARRFADRGLHAFVLQLPGYGERWDGSIRHPGVTAMMHGGQAVADCRRARDAIAALPNIKPGPIALQGTSLGGFVAATAGAIDGAFDPVVLLISGADGYEVLQTGLHDARSLKQALNRQGYRGDALRALLEPIEPLNVAHRLDPKRTWLISARDDLTIPRASSDALAKAAGLDDAHRLWLGTNHYTTLLVLPGVTDQMVELIQPPPEHHADD